MGSSEISTERVSVTSPQPGGSSPSSTGSEDPSVETRPAWWARAGAGAWAATRTYWPTGVLLVVLVLAWQFAVRFFNVPNYIIPAPSEIYTSLTENWTDILRSATWTTLTEVLVGFGAAIVTGLVVAIALHWSPGARKVVYPLLIASQTVPIVVIAPVLAIIFGYTLTPKVLLVAFVCFFSIVVNMLDGLSSADPQLLRVMRTLDGTRMGAFRKIEFPSSLPSLFTGLKIAATYAAVGAVFGELGGSEDGLGYVMVQATPQMQTALVFAAIFLLSIMSITLFIVVTVLERVLVPWAKEGK